MGYLRVYLRDIGSAGNRPLRLAAIGNPNGRQMTEGAKAPSSADAERGG